MKPALPLLAFSAAAFIYGVASTPGSAPSEKVNFGREVQPIISKHCFKCHGPDAAQAAGGLRLDSFQGATKRLSDGSAIVPGSPERSILISRVSEKNAGMRMPPPGSGLKPLSDEEISVLRAWISQGARYEKHWAFIPPAMPSLPGVRDATWCRNPIDRFVLAGLERAGFRPEPEADPDTLAMRAAETLTGLPPSSADLESFRGDKQPGAYERFVDRLLAEPTYGEHQARYWLDAVRYGDTHGLQLDNERLVYPYRDWVVSAFNRDLPFDQFAKWQLAGDLLPHPTTEQLVATGYVRMNLTSNEGGAIEDEFLARNTFDRVDTMSTVFLGLTVGCAKCHDHKYDPIKQTDYYGLYAFFDSTQDKPLDGNIALPPPVVRAANPEQEKRLASLSHKAAALVDRVDPARAMSLLSARHEAAPSTRDWAISEVYPSPTFDAAFDQAEPPEPGQKGATHWKPVAFKVGQDNASLVGRDNASVYVRGTVRLPAATRLTLGVSSDDAVKIWLNGKLIHAHKINRGLNEGIDPVKAEFRAGDNELIAKLVNGGGPDGLNIRIAGASQQRILNALQSYRMKPRSAEAIKALREEFLLDGPSSDDARSYRRLVKEHDDLESSIPMTLIAREMASPRPTFVLKRGQYDQKGEPVSRHIPACVGELPKGAPVNRLGFAEWLVSPSDPLVARVFVNRVWQQAFGTGIVKTSEDFGTQGEWPTNQSLLDYLAVSFVRDGWSVKQLNRQIVTSAAFRQSSKITLAKLAKDPENRLISRGPRYRLDAEVIRDKALATGGLLVEKLGGRGFKPYQPDGLWEAASDPASSTHFYVRDRDSSIYRRSLYLYWKRTSPPPVMITFDSPLRDSCTVRRSRTNTPLQALASLNEPAFLEASRTMAQRLLSQPGSDDERIRRAFDVALGRLPGRPELTIMHRALARYRARYGADPSAAKRLVKVGDAPLSSKARATEVAIWMMVCSSLMNTDEFLSLH